jgi:CBS domain containing-hemolysin-like protein
MLVSGSYQGIVVVDDKDRYRGVIMPADLYSGLIESSSNRASIISLTRHRDTFLKPNMNVKAAMEHFDRAEAELLAVVSDDAHLKLSAISPNRTLGVATPKSLIRQPKESCKRSEAKLL